MRVLILATSELVHEILVIGATRYILFSLHLFRTQMLTSYSQVRNERDWGVVVYEGHTDLADVRYALYSLPVMFNLCDDGDMMNMFSAAKKGLDVILKGTYLRAFSLFIVPR